MRFGLIAEDERDCNAYTERIGKIRNDVTGTVPVPCQGVGNLKTRFVGYLKYFEYSEPVDKVLIIRDSDCSDPLQRELELQAILASSHFHPSYPFHSCPEARRVHSLQKWNGPNLFFSSSSGLFDQIPGVASSHSEFRSPLVTRPLSPLESALTQTPPHKSFRIRTYEKRRGAGCYVD